MNRLAMGLLSACLVLASGTIEAQEAGVATVEIRFWAFSSNPQFFAYQTTNHHGEEVLFVGQAGSPDPVFQQPGTADQSAREILLSREVRDAYGWNSGGNEGETSPNGTFAVELAEAGANLSVTVRQGINANPLGQIARLSPDGGRSYADFELKQVFWSDTESHVVVIVHQELGGEWPVQVDTAHGFAAPDVPDAPPPPPPGGGE